MPPIVKDPHRIRLAMLGMVDGNGHPYSWSAIINGRYDARAMEECGYPVIPQYLGAAPRDQLGIPGAQVTHVWCDDPEDARKVARAAFIEHVVDRPQDVIGQVDAVVIPTDIGGEHVERARPFIEAGLPLFIDKPLVDSADDLAQFIGWKKQGRPLISGSALRYGREYGQMRNDLASIGELRLITMTMAKTWERYGIHAVEAVYPFLPPGGWLSVSHRGTDARNIMHLRHRDGVEVVVAVIADLYGAFGCMNAYGTRGSLSSKMDDTFTAFREQLVRMVHWLRTGEEPFAFVQTVELMKIIIAGLRSRAEGGREVRLDEIG
jgi:predicted dehydrogenase